MAVEAGETSGLSLQALLKPGGSPCVKAEEPDQGGLTLKTLAMGTEEAPGVVRVGTITQCFSWETPTAAIKQEPEEGLSSPGWDTSWREFLGGTESPPSSQGNGQLLEPTLLPPFEEMTANEGYRPRDEPLSQALLGLNGLTQLASGGPGTSERGDGEMVKEEMEAEESAGSDVERQRFRQFCYPEAEGPREVYGHLWHLCRQWLQPERRTKEQILDLLILEQLLTILPVEMQSWVKKKGAKTCAQAVALAENFLEERQEGERQVEQVPGLLSMMAMNFSSAEPLSSGNTQRRPGRKVKEEGEEVEQWHVSSMVSDGQVSNNGRKLCDVSLERTSYQEQEKKLRGQDELAAQEEIQSQKWRNKSNTFQVISYHEIAMQQRLHKGKRRNRCSVCGKNFRNESNLIRHWRTHPGEKPYRCSDCGKIFCWISQLDRHRRTHTGERPYKCLDCGKTFTWSSHLKSHRRIHTGERPYQCSICNKTFLSSSGMIRHQRTHTGEKPFECSDCSKSFGAKSSLISHQTIHTGERSYQCLECGKSFNRSHTLVRHQRIHDTEKPYKCSECAKSFNLIQHLIRHQRNHTGEKPHQCSDCSKSFLDKSSLVKHQRIHSGEKPYACADCGKSFSQGQHLMRHQIIHTGERF